MKVEELFERVGTNVLCCDIQPEYDTWCKRIAPLACDFLNKQTGKIVILYNGQGQTSDDSSDTVDYLHSHGFDPSKSNFQLYEKEYGFFRNWMGKINDHAIILTIREMINNRVDNSRKLEYKLNGNPLSKEKQIYINVLNSNGLIWLPDFMTISELRSLSPFYLIGGSESKCLREIELICNAFNIRFRRIQNLIY